MPKREIDIHGAPGTGKTRAIQSLAVTAARDFGPESVGATTFTRAAAAELRSRLGASLGISDERRLRKLSPNIGTIHSLAWSAIGRPEIVTPAHLQQFARDINTDANFRVLNPNSDFDPIQGDSLQLAEVSPQMTDVELMATLLAGLRHRKTWVEAKEVGWPNQMGSMFQEVLPPEMPAGTSVDRLVNLAGQYFEWKHARGVVDFEDVLEMGRHWTPPVRVLICDEAQDNTPLLWSVVDAWASHVHTLIVAGDPYQSIYLFAGADPRLFRDRGGDWLHLSAAHRFDDRSAQYAKEILKRGGWSTDKDAEFHDSWRGVGDSPSDGTTFYLARTHSLLAPIERNLQEQAIPYAKLRGKAPLQTKVAQEFKELMRGERKALSKAASTYYHLPYLEGVWSAHGEQAFIRPPTISIGTIHAAKGREADEVHLVRSWGILPARNAREKPQEEACVAYVAASRHRKRLIFEEADGIPYSFPPALELAHV